MNVSIAWMRRIIRKEVISRSGSQFLSPRPWAPRRTGFLRFLVWDSQRQDQHHQVVHQHRRSPFRWWLIRCIYEVRYSKWGSLENRDPTCISIVDRLSGGVGTL